MKQLTVRELLVQNGVKPSLHRMKILEYLLLRKNHPTVDIIFRDISAEIPTLSKTTIYNTLKLFQEHGVAQFITIDENEIRLDACVEDHAHFKCLRCGAIFDVELKGKLFAPDKLGGHEVRERQVYLKGICRDCRQKS